MATPTDGQAQWSSKSKNAKHRQEGFRRSHVIFEFRIPANKKHFSPTCYPLPIVERVKKKRSLLFVETSQFLVENRNERVL